MEQPKGQQPVQYEAPDVPHWAVQIPEGGIAGVVMAVIAGVLWLRRRLSSDNKIIASDKAETQFIESLQQELVKARAALEAVYKERNDLLAEVGGLRVKVEFLTKEDLLKEERIKKLERKLGITGD